MIRLRFAGKPQRVWKVYDMKPRDVVRAFRIVETGHDRLMRAWEEMHGKGSDD